MFYLSMIQQLESPLFMVVNCSNPEAQKEHFSVFDMSQWSFTTLMMGQLYVVKKEHADCIFLC